MLFPRMAFCLTKHLAIKAASAVAPKGYGALRQDVSKTPYFWPRHFGVSRHELVVEVPRRCAQDLEVSNDSIHRLRVGPKKLFQTFRRYD